VKRALDITLFVLVLVGTLTAIGQLLSRIDRGSQALRVERTRIDNANESIADLRHEFALIDMGRYDAELRACEQRTENLHQVLDILVRTSALWPDRVKLPRGPVEWMPWPTKERIDALDKERGETEKP
jgi:hypothetical protein